MYQTIVFLPLIAALIAGLFGSKLGNRGAQVVTCGALVVSAVLSWVAFFQVAMAPGDHSTHVQVLSWIVSGDF
ncbi:MAG: NADH-quinone oxidoreductase subunit L, partial [Kordiimonadaceae bacterium]|nr:NADH-quinone oxidoreductase subunit L [Kordiimonadaceae bacterium]